MVSVGQPTRGRWALVLSGGLLACASAPPVDGRSAINAAPPFVEVACSGAGTPAPASRSSNSFARGDLDTRFADLVREHGLRAPPELAAAAVEAAEQRRDAIDSMEESLPPGPATYVLVADRYDEAAAETGRLLDAIRPDSPEAHRTLRRARELQRALYCAAAFRYGRALTERRGDERASAQLDAYGALFRCGCAEETHR